NQHLNANGPVGDNFITVSGDECKCALSIVYPFHSSSNGDDLYW
ncbi:unnamed protein product, partial [Rotaria sp. Silwood1]